MQLLNREWRDALKSHLDSPQFIALSQFVDDEYDNKTIYPPKDKLFSAFELTPLSSVNIVILGQDPYHGQGQANGLAFSVTQGIALPPSLKNIFKVIDGGDVKRASGDLTNWAEQGVLLLNTVLSVRAGEANSHKNKGWEQFTDAVIKRLNQENRPIVFMLWGKPAQTKLKWLNNPNHLYLTAPHPSPLSAYRGFFDCDHFAKANDFLMSHDLDSIIW